MDLISVKDTAFMVYRFLSEHEMEKNKNKRIDHVARSRKVIQNVNYHHQTAWPLSYSLCKVSKSRSGKKTFALINN